MDYRYEDGDILIQTIQDKNISKCVQARRMNNLSFFEEAISDAASEEWIRRHRQSVDDVLLELIYKQKDCFVGTVGFTIHGDVAEVGRLTLYPPAIKSLIRSGITTAQLQKITKSGCLLTVDYLFQSRKVRQVYCEVLADNYYSNSLCMALGGIPVPCKKRMKNGAVLDIHRYEIIRESYNERYCC